jgi:hypothetical protein
MMGTERHPQCRHSAEAYERRPGNSLPPGAAHFETYRRGAEHRPLGEWRLDALEHQRTVGPTKAKVVFHRNIDF